MADSAIRDVLWVSQACGLSGLPMRYTASRAHARGTRYRVALTVFCTTHSVILSLSSDPTKRMYQTRLMSARS